MCKLGDVTTAATAEILAQALGMKGVPVSLWEYALLVEVTATPHDRAMAYLRDCGNSPEQAKGRLLLRAAERALRKAGEIE